MLRAPDFLSVLLPSGLIIAYNERLLITTLETKEQKMTRYTYVITRTGNQEPIVTGEAYSLAECVKLLIATQTRWGNTYNTYQLVINDSELLRYSSEVLRFNADSGEFQVQITDYCLKIRERYLVNFAGEVVATLETEPYGVDGQREALSRWASAD